MHSGHAKTYLNLGVALESCIHYTRASTVHTGLADAYYSMGNALMKSKVRSSAHLAGVSYARASTVHSGYADAYSNFGNALASMMYGMRSSIHSYTKVSTMHAGHATTYSNLAVVLQSMGKMRISIRSSTRARNVHLN